MSRMSPEERYLHDPQFKRLVDMLEKQIHECQYTPTELREAAILAAIHYENKRMAPPSWYIDPESWEKARKG
jgi:hypothetical protein